MFSLDFVEGNDARGRRLKIDGCVHEHRHFQSLRFGGEKLTHQ